MKQAWMVDDDQDMIHAVSLLLKLLDFNVRSFISARAAAQTLLAGTPPDLLLMDVNMPEVTGIELLRFVRSRPQWQKLPVLMLSSESTDVQIEEALKLGADGYLTKPVTLEELQKGTQIALQRAAARSGPQQI